MNGGTPQITLQLSKVLVDYGSILTCYTKEGMLTLPKPQYSCFSKTLMLMSSELNLF